MPVAVPGLGPAGQVLAFSKSFDQIPGNGLDVKSNVNTDLGFGKAFFEENRAANGPRTTAFGGSFRPIEGLNLSAQRQKIDEGPTKDRFGVDYENSGIFKAFAESNDKKPSMLIKTPINHSTGMLVQDTPDVSKAGKTSILHFP